MNEKKKGVVIGGIIAGIAAAFTAISTVVGFVTDVSSWGHKDNKKNDTTQVVQNIETTEANTTTEAVDTVVTTEITTVEETTAEETTTEETTMPENPEDLYLHNITPTQSESFSNSDCDNETDTIGNHYVGNVQCINRNGYVIYYLGGNYSRLQGVIAANDGDFNNDNTATISILVDDKEVYSTGEFSRISTPMEVDIDVSGANWLKIQHSGTNISSFYGNGAGVILANFKFVK